MNLAQHITRILTTRPGERVALPTYGSELYKLRDRALTNEVRLMFTVYCKAAIEKWENVKVSKAELTAVNTTDGSFSFTISLSNGETIVGVA